MAKTTAVRLKLGDIWEQSAEVKAKAAKTKKWQKIGMNMEDDEGESLHWDIISCNTLEW